MLDLIGKKFGRLIVLQFINRDKWGDARWLCLCECKKKKIISGGNLQRNHTKSCGCLAKEGSRLSHGHAKDASKTYKTWSGLLQRCTNPKASYYKNYGGRGIKVCERWLKFENFLKDMGEAPPGYQIDRIDNNKGYCKSNCRWVTPKQQQRNRRNNRLITFNRKTQCMMAWAEEFNIHRNVLTYRLDQGWSIKKAIMTPVRKCNKRGK